LHLGDIVNGGATEEATKNELELIASIFDKQVVRSLLSKKCQFARISCPNIKLI
jgi:hypothetical protein